MKKFLIVLSLLIFAFSLSVFAEGELLITVEEKEAEKGAEVILNVDIKENPGILALLFEVTYDKERLELLSSEDKEIVPGAMFSKTVEKYPYICLYNSASAFDSTEVGTLFSLTFKVKDDAKPGKAFVKLEFAEENIFNAKLDAVEVEIADGGIIIPGDESEEEEVEKEEKGEKNETTAGTTGGSSGGSRKTRSKAAKTTDKKETEKQAEVDDKNKIIFAIGKTEARVFGEIKHNDVAPLIRNDRTMLPARFVAESLGAEVFWDEKEEKVTVKKEDTVILVFIGSDRAYINGEEKILDSPAFTENDRTYTPLRFIVEGLGSKVEWIKETMEIVVSR